MEELVEQGTTMDATLLNAADLLSMALRFAFSTFVVWLMVHKLYYPKSHRRDYYFTYMLISISIFFLIYLLGGVKLKIGFALGLFAIFGIIRYRTESMPVREMTYLFCIISLSVINALATSTSYLELLVTNAIFLCSAWLLEKRVMNNGTHSKLVQYDRIDLITPEKREELIADLRKRTGLDVVRVDVGSIDFLRDMTILKVHYRSDQHANNTIENHLKPAKEEWEEVDT